MRRPLLITVIGKATLRVAKTPAEAVDLALQLAKDRSASDPSKEFRS